MIVGLRAIEVRDLLRKIGESEVTADWFDGGIGVVRGLIEARLLEAAEDRQSQPGEYYRVSEKGLAYRQVRFIPRIDRAKADRLLAEFLNRVERANANPDFISSISEIRV